MNTNLIALRRKEHFESLNLEIQKELDDFYDTKAATHQLKHTKISSEEISDGRKYSLLFRYVKVVVSC